ncbi:MAG: MATE family efflux transporter [Ruminococcaceae bacterium]|nr:MATE family efflux transporter [Oscillospiraceae bacterium]
MKQNKSIKTTAQLQHIKMTQTPIPKLVTAMAIPTVTSMLVTVVYNTADTYFVAQIDKSASAAVGVVFAIMEIVMALGYGVGVGAGSLVSRKLGAKENEKADIYASSGIFAAVAVGTVLMVIGLSFLDVILKLLGCTDTMLPHAAPYAKFVLLAAPLNCATFTLNNLLRSQGMTKLAMIGMGAGGILNIIIDPLFIFNLGLGTAGASIATMISQTASFVILASCFVTRRSVVNLRLKNISRRAEEYKDIVSLGMPTMVRNGLASLAAAVLNIQAIKYGGDTAAAAITISNKLYTLVRSIAFGIGQGFQPVAGYNYGAGNKKRTWQSFVFTLKLGTLVCVAFAAGIWLGADKIMHWFSTDVQVAQIGVQTLRFSSTIIPLLAFSTYVNHLYQSLGFRLQATFLASCRQGICFLPIVILLPQKMGVLGVQTAQPIADLCTAIVSLPFILYFYKKYVKEQA